MRIPHTMSCIFPIPQEIMNYLKQTTDQISSKIDQLHDTTAKSAVQTYSQCIRKYDSEIYSTNLFAMYTICKYGSEIYSANLFAMYM
jgi:uncharacterized protein YaaR (DUF327 family)